MIVEADVTGLEVVGIALLSGDVVLINELKNKEDIHDNNQKAFNLPSRLVAKVFKFRLIYGATAFAFTKDPDFNWISNRVDYWEEVKTSYYKKYTGIDEFHTNLYNQVLQSGTYCSPTGRVYRFRPFLKNGEYSWPRPQILNYPVQGLGADIMSIARVATKRRLLGLPEVLLINTVHDSIVLDTPKKHLYTVCKTLAEVFADIPKNFTKLFGVPFDIPMSGKIKYGTNWLHTEEFIDGY